MRAGRMAIIVALCALGTMALMPPLFTAGPIIEATVLPPIQVSAADIGITPGPSPSSLLMRFTLNGQKHRPCRLENYGVGWRVDHSIAPVGLFQANGTTSEQIPATIQDGESFTMGPFYAPIVSAARSAPHAAALSITFYYRCHALWLTEEDLSILLPGSP